MVFEKLSEDQKEHLIASLSVAFLHDCGVKVTADNIHKVTFFVSLIYFLGN